MSADKFGYGFDRGIQPAWGKDSTGFIGTFMGIGDCWPSCDSFHRIQQLEKSAC